MSGTAYFGSASQGFGLAGEAHWSSFSPTRWCAGSATDFCVSGLGCPEWTVALPEGRPWLQKCDGSSCRLPRSIRFGGHHGSSESSKCSASWFRSAPFPVCCGPYRRSYHLVSGLLEFSDHFRQTPLLALGAHCGTAFFIAHPLV